MRDKGVAGGAGGPSGKRAGRKTKGGDRAPAQSLQAAVKKASAAKRSARKSRR
jgi:hypothetical protein